MPPLIAATMRCSLYPVGDQAHLHTNIHTHTHTHMHTLTLNLKSFLFASVVLSFGVVLAHSLSLSHSRSHTLLSTYIAS
jgi:hypothetical protein